MPNEPKLTALPSGAYVVLSTPDMLSLTVLTLEEAKRLFKQLDRSIAEATHFADSLKPDAERA